LLAAAAAQAGTQAPSAQPWSGAQASSTCPIPSTIACRSALHSFSGGSPVVLSSVSPVSLAVEVSLAEAGWVVSPVSLPLVLSPAVLAVSPAPVVGALVGPPVGSPPPLGSPVALPSVVGVVPPVASLALTLASVAEPVALASLPLPPPQAATSRHPIIHRKEYPLSGIGSPISHPRATR